MYGGVPHNEWLGLKHNNKPSCLLYPYGARDDYDCAETPRGYSFISAATPMQLRNDSGGMDEDEEKSKDVWCPFQSAAIVDAVEPMDSDMSDGQSTGDDMEIEDVNAHETMQVDQFHQQQFQQQKHMQQTAQPINFQQAAIINKRKRGCDALEQNTEMNTYQYQQMPVDNSKRVRVGA
jgi:hypothetical protein